MDTAPQTSTRPVKELVLSVGIFVAIGAVLAGVHLLTGWGIPCGMRMLTGWLCPFCGGTRMASSLLHGDIVSAWEHNLLLFVVCTSLGIRTIGWIIEWLVLHRETSQRWIPYSISRHWVAIMLLVCLGWVLIRNLT